jgi:hypothetical protein
MGTTLAFYARGDLLVAHPSAPRVVGQHPRYVGRAPLVDPQTGAATWPATSQPFNCDASSDVGKRLVKVCRRGALWPANEATAQACGVPFVQVAHFDGEWIEPLPELPPKRSAAKAPKD